jgi:hypothetical protein
MLAIPGTVAIAMGCYGIGAVLPVVRTMKQAGNRVIAIMEARAKEHVSPPLLPGRGGARALRVRVQPVLRGA